MAYQQFLNIGFAPSLAGDLLVPAGSRVSAAVVLIHGGSWASGDKSIMRWTARRLVSSGFVVFNINYRLAPRDPFPSALEDCQSAVRWLRSNSSTYRINPDKIAAWGFSAGGHLAALLGTATSDPMAKVQAVVAGSAPHDLTLYPHHPTTARFLGTSWETNAALFRSASPLFNVGASSPPMFLFHGAWDRIVDPKHTEEMANALGQVGIECQTEWIPYLGHLAVFVLGCRTERRAIGFLKRVLRV